MVPIHHYWKLCIQDHCNSNNYVTSGRFASTGQSTKLPMLHDSPTHPIYLGISTNGLVERIYHDDLKIFVGRVLSNPIGVQDSQSLNTSSDPFFGNGLEVTNGFLLLDASRSLGLAVRTSFGHGPFATSAAHGNAVDDKALLVLVSQTTSLVWTS